MTAGLQSLGTRLDDAKHNRPIKLAFGLVQPMDQTKQYDQAIQMLQLHMNEEIDVDAETFRNLVMDDWQWTRQWAASNSGYTTSEVSKSYLSSKGEE